MLFTTNYPNSGFVFDGPGSNRLGIQDASPDAILEISRDGGDGIDYLMISTDDDNDGDILSVRTTGNVGIGTTSPTQRLTVFNGTTTGTYTTTGWAHSSDRRLKTNIQTIDNALDKVQALNGVSFDWKNSKDEPRQIGFIAQEVEQVLPEVVLVDSLGNYSMAYGNLTAVLVNAIIEQQHTIQKLEAVVAQEQAAAEKREATLEARMQTLEEIIRLTER